MGPDIGGGKFLFPFFQHFDAFGIIGALIFFFVLFDFGDFIAGELPCGLGGQITGRGESM